MLVHGGPNGNSPVILALEKWFRCRSFNCLGVNRAGNALGADWVSHLDHFKVQVWLVSAGAVRIERIKYPRFSLLSTLAVRWERQFDVSDPRFFEKLDRFVRKGK